MIDTRLYDGHLCETFSTIHNKLIQQETGKKYGWSCVDLIEGFYDDGKPYSRYTYIESEEYDDSDAIEENKVMEE